jgi:hypothetical protein
MKNPRKNKLFLFPHPDGIAVKFTLNSDLLPDGLREKRDKEKLMERNAAGYGCGE